MFLRTDYWYQLAAYLHFAFSSIFELKVWKRLCTTFYSLFHEKSLRFLVYTMNRLKNRFHKMHLAKVSPHYVGLELITCESFTISFSFEWIRFYDFSTIEWIQQDHATLPGHFRTLKSLIFNSIYFFSSNLRNACNFIMWTDKFRCCDEKCLA